MYCYLYPLVPHRCLYSHTGVGSVEPDATCTIAHNARFFQHPRSFALSSSVVLSTRTDHHFALLQRYLRDVPPLEVRNPCPPWRGYTSYLLIDGV